MTMGEIMIRAILLSGLLGLVAGCQGRMDGIGTPPLNKKEEVEYRIAAARCLKTGGTRIVKIYGKITCF